MTDLLETRAIGTDLTRRDGHAKVTGTAPYAYEHPVEAPAYAAVVEATVARGTVTAIDTTAAEALDGVLLVLTHENAERLADASDAGDAELAVLQDAEVPFRGRPVALVVATSPETARQAADLVDVTYDVHEHETEMRTDGDLYRPETVNPGYPTDTDEGDLDAALAAAAVVVDETYTTPQQHHMMMEPHTTVACWDGRDLTLYESTQAVHGVRDSVAPLFGLDPERVRVVCPYVGGGFGGKGNIHAHAVLAVLAARALPGRAVKLALTRPQMFTLGGYRTPTRQRVRLAADRDGRLDGLGVDVVELTSRIKEFAEQTAVPYRMMYASPNRRTSHRLASLDVPVPTWMRAPGEAPGMFALEVAMDELAEAAGVDPVELRARNEPETDPESGLPFSSRNLVACLRDGARRFGWDGRDSLPRKRNDDGWWVGTGVAASTYPAFRMPRSAATVRLGDDGRFRIGIGAADLGTGAWTVLAQIGADALGVDVDRIELAIGDTNEPWASVAGGSSGTSTWGTAIATAAAGFREKFGSEPRPGDELTDDVPQQQYAKEFSMHAFGAQFAEVRVHEATGEVRVPRLLGVFAVGRVVNPRLARSQFLGGMTMGLSMALHEDAVVDHRFGHVVNHDLAGYHVAADADVAAMDAYWVDEHDPYVNPMGSKGIGEIGIVGTAAAVANAAYHATGVRVRDLPVTLDHFLG